MTKTSDIVILGGGPGGYVGALAAAIRGASVTLIEKDKVGGACLHRGCIPTKTLLATAHLAMSISKSEVFAIKHKGFEIDFSALMKRKNDIVSRLEKGILTLLKKRKINLITGSGKVLAPDELEVNTGHGKERFKAGKGLVIATGSEPIGIDSIPFDGRKVFSSDEILSIESIPKSLCIIGAGVIGFEMAELFHAFGTEVTLVEALPRILSGMDEDIAIEAARLLRRRKIKMHTGVTAEKFVVADNSVRIELDDGKVIETEKVLVAVGRIPRTRGFGLEQLSVIGNHHHVKTNEVGRTKHEKLFAAGDVTFSRMLAHFASAQCNAAVRTALGEEVDFDKRAIPNVIYTKPEIASVGLEEDVAEMMAEEFGMKVKTSRFDIRALGRAQAEDEIIGLVKIVGDEKTGLLLGVHIMARGAGEMIHEAALAIRRKLKVSDLAETVHAHPGFSEAIEEAAHIWMGLPRHG